MTTIETLKAELATLQEKLAKLEASQPQADKLWVPRGRDMYWFISSTGETPSSNLYSNTSLEDFHNVFPTREKAEKHARFLRAFNELARVADYVNEGWAPDWGDQMSGKYCVVYHHDTDAWLVYSTWVASWGSVAYFRSGEAAKRALAMLSDEAKEILKQGVY